jgi:hypothetical protein
MSNSKSYRTKVRSDADYDELPNVATFVIDEATAKEIIRLSAMVKANSLYKVEKFDYRVSFIKQDEDEPNEQVEQAELGTDADCLKVSETEFWFSAYLKHTNVEVLTERQRIADLATHFGLEVEAESDVKFYIGKLHERNGEHEYVHTLRFMTNDDPDKYLDFIASRLYHEDGGEEDGESYSFEGGCIAVTPRICREITKEFFVQCHEYGI